METNGKRASISSTKKRYSPNHNIPPVAWFWHFSKSSLRQSTALYERSCKQPIREHFRSGDNANPCSSSSAIYFQSTLRSIGQRTIIRDFKGARGAWAAKRPCYVTRVTGSRAFVDRETERVSERDLWTSRRCNDN